MEDRTEKKGMERFVPRNLIEAVITCR